MFRKMSVVIALVVIILSVSAGLLAKERNENPGFFFRGDMILTQNETAGKLLVIDGNAQVAGKIDRWVAVIHGNLIIKKEANIGGSIIVLEGYIKEESGATISSPLKLVLPPGSPYLKLFICLAALLLTLALLATVAAGWVLLNRLRELELHEKVWQKIAPEKQRAVLLFGGLAASGLLLAFFVELTADTIFQQETDFADQTVIWLVRYFADPQIDKIMLSITALGSGYAYAILTPLVITLLYWRGRKLEGGWLIVCLAGGAFLNFLLKHLFERARPEMYKVISETGYSFPSGHAMVSICFYGMLVYILGRKIAQLKIRLLLYGLTLIMLAVIGISRIYLGVHYPSDVLAGYIAGGVWLTFCMALLWWGEKREHALDSAKADKTDKY